ncbi:MAG: riboflavin synthase [Chitinivibrionia bacterium]|nr:riboflavin synthase [Chitinivibrionia bacterium]
MFTGLIETTGEIKSFSLENKSAVIEILPKTDDFYCKIGDSVAINGVCLTVEKINGKQLFFRAVSETLSKTTFNNIKISQPVNLERAMPANGRFGGHIVLGHIDTVAKIENIQNIGDSQVFSASIKDEYFKYIAKKGSVAVDGISLTVSDITENGFLLSVIPHTLKNTTLISKKVGDLLNLECDVFARYVERMLNFDEKKTIKNDENFLELLKGGGF